MPIVMTRAEEDSRAKSLDAGINDYLKKPFDVSQIVSRIELNLGKAG